MGTVNPVPPNDQITFNFGSITGADVLASTIADGLPFNPGLQGAAVVITTQTPFTSVTLSAALPSFEFAPSVPVVLFAGTPGNANCYGQSVSTLARQYGGLNAAATALDYASVPALQNAIMTYCGG